MGCLWPTGNDIVVASMRPASASGAWLNRHFPLALIIIAYLLVGTLYATNTPAWQAPDEPAHYNYVRQLAAGNLPVIAPADYDEAYRSRAVSSGFAPDYPIEPLTYEDWQPPLYYLFLTPVFSLSGGALTALRLASLLLGAGILIAAHGVALLRWPHKRWLALTATAFVAFLPQHVAILASVNNDSLSELLIALMLWAIATNVVLARQGQPLSLRRWFLPGLLLGLGFLTKLTTYIMAPLILAAIFMIYRRQYADVIRSSLAAFIPAASLGSIWWLRNLLVYDGFDPLANMAHDAAVVGQPRTVEWIASFGPLETIGRFAETTFRSFWGQFGWMGVLMEPRVYQLLLAFSVLIVVGVLWRATFASPRAEESADSKIAASLRLLLVLLFALNVLLYIGYNATYVQHQGRYLFAALIPIAIGVAAAIEAWVRPLTARWWLTAPAVPLFFSLALIGLDLLALFRYIVPQLAAP